MHTLPQDLRFALRQLRRAPGFALTAVLTLALGIGATTAIFTLVYQVILRSLPVSHPEQLYKIGAANDCCVTSGLQEPWGLFSYDLYKTLRDGTMGIDGMAAVQSGELFATARRPGNEVGAQPLAVRFVSGNYFSVLGVKSYSGHLFQESEDTPGAAPVAVLSYALWRTKFAADPHLVGSTLLLSGHPVMVIGVAAPGFLGERNETDPAGVWLPLAQEPTLEPDRKLLQYPAEHWLDLLLRVPAANRVPQIQQALQTELRRWVLSHPEISSQVPTAEQIRRITTAVVPASGGINSLQDRYGKNLRLLLLLTGFVLLIACANLANLMLVRGMARHSELALRSALGASRARLIRQTFVEALLLALGGGLLAVLVAYAGTHAILVLAFKGVEMSTITSRPSLPVLGFAFAISILTGVLFGIAPAWITSRFGPADALRGANRSTGDTTAVSQRLLIIFQAAISLALLSTAGLLITNLRHLQHQDFRFQPQGRLIVFTDLGGAGYQANRLEALYRQMDDAFSRLPSIERFAYATYGPMAYSKWNTGIWFSGPDTKGSLAGYLAASAEYFPTIGTHVLLGRGFSRNDTASSEHVAVVNQAFVDQLLKHKQPIGMRFGPDPALRNEYEIVGVVENTKYGDPTLPVSPMFFVPITQYAHFTDQKDASEEASTHFAANLFVQYRGDAGAVANQIRNTLKSINPDIPVLQILTYEEQLGNNFTQEQLIVRLTALFGFIALVLASVGLYGVTAYTVTRRKGEIGVRMALGASRGHVLGLILRGALTQAAIGLAVGVPLSLLGGRLLQHSLYQTGAFQPGMLFAIVILLLVSAAGASLLPARRAASINPTEALRAE